MSPRFRQLFPLLLSIFIDSFSYFVVIPILLQLYFNNQFALLAVDTSQATRGILTGFTICISTVAALIAAPVIGSISDQYGRKKTLLGCLTLLLLGFLLPIVGIVYHRIELVLLGRIVGGVASASQPVVRAAVADLCAGQEKALLISWVSIVITLAMIVGPLTGAYLSDPTLVSWFTVTTPYWFASGLLVFNFFLVALGFRETLPKFTKASPKLISLRAVIKGFKQAVDRYHLGLLWLILFCLALGDSQYYHSIFLYLTQYFHYTTQQSSIYGAYLGGMSLLSLLVVYPILSRFMSVEKCLRLSVVLMLLGASACALVPIPLVQWLCAPLSAIFSSIAAVCLIILISNRVAVEDQGWIMGYTSSIVWLAWLLTAFGSGWLMAFYASLPLYVAALTTLLGSLALWLGSTRLGSTRQAAV